MRRCGIFAGTHGVALNGSSTSRSHTRPVSLLWHAKSWLHQAHVRRGLPTDAELQQSKSKRSIDWKRRQDVRLLFAPLESEKLMLNRGNEICR